MHLAQVGEKTKYKLSQKKYRTNLNDKQAAINEKIKNVIFFLCHSFCAAEVKKVNRDTKCKLRENQQNEQKHKSANTVNRAATVVCK